MIYRLPETSDKIILQEYIKEHYDHAENSISASLGLPVTDYDLWLKKILDNAENGDDWGRSLLYLAFDEERLIGLLSIRYELPAKLTDIYGDIGYGVRPSERNKGYATEMLRYALAVCKEKGKDKVVIGCYKDNIPSSTVIKRCGGILLNENDNYKSGKLSQYFLVNTGGSDDN